MSGYETLLLLHLVGALTLVTGIVFQIPVVFRANIPQETQARLMRVGGPLAGAGAMILLIFGLWLVADRDYGFFDAWIIVSLVLWAIASAIGPRVVGPESRHLFVIAMTAVVVILVLMTFKPGA